MHGPVRCGFTTKVVGGVDVKRKVQVTLLGQRFTVRSEKDAAYVHTLANFVTRKFEDLQHQTRSVSTHELALLVAMNIADELFECEERFSETRRALRQHSERLLKNLDSALSRMDATADEETSAPLAVVETPSA